MHNEYARAYGDIRDDGRVSSYVVDVYGKIKPIHIFDRWLSVNKSRWFYYDKSTFAFNKTPRVNASSESGYETEKRNNNWHNNWQTNPIFRFGYFTVCALLIIFGSGCLLRGDGYGLIGALLSLAILIFLITHPCGAFRQGGCHEGFWFYEFGD